MIVGRQQPVITDAISVGSPDQRQQLADEVLWLENQAGCPILPGTAQAIVDSAIGRQREAFTGYWPARNVATKLLQSLSIVGRNTNPSV